MSFAAISTLIGTKLSGISDIQVVKAEHTDNFSGFPAATYEPSRNENAYITNAENERRYAFDIVIHQELTKATRADGIRILRETVDAVITAFDTDYNLSGNVDFVLALPSEWGEYVGGNSPIKYAMLTLICVKSTQVIT